MEAKNHNCRGVESCLVFFSVLVCVEIRVCQYFPGNFFLNEGTMSAHYSVTIFVCRLQIALPFFNISTSYVLLCRLSLSSTWVVHNYLLLITNKDETCIRV